MTGRLRSSIRRRLTAMNLLVSGAVLLTASCAFAGYEIYALRAEMIRNLSTAARILGANSASAILFDDRAQARVTLSALTAAPTVESAALYTPSGLLFAAYSRKYAAAPPAGPTLTPGLEEVSVFSGGSLTLFRIVEFEGRTIGIVYLRSDLSEIYSRLYRYAWISLAIFIAALPAAMVFSSVFQRSTAEPMMRLAEVARLVSTEKLYSVRAAPGEGGDEIALLIDAFNQMLDQIEQRDAALQHTHEQLNLALRSAGIGAWSWSPQDDRIAWDESMLPLLGLPSAPNTEASDRFSFVHSADVALLRRALQNTLATDTPLAIDFRIFRPDRSTRTLSARGKVVRTGDDRSRRIMGVCWDITERLRSEEERTKLVSLIEQTPVFVAMIGLDGRIAYLNPAALRLTGLDADRISSIRFIDLFPPEWRFTTGASVFSPFERPAQHWTGEVVLTNRETGERANGLMSAFTVTEPQTGSVLCHAAIVRDITARKRLEEQLLQSQKLDSLGQLAGGVAHDFNNLLTIVAGYAELLMARHKPGEPDYEPAEQISRASTRATALTRQLLTFGRRQPIEPTDVQVNEVVSNVEKMLRRLLGAGVELNLRLDWPGGVIRADAGQLEQIIVNLAINARDAMPDGGTLNIATEQVYVDEETGRNVLSLPPGSYVGMTVSDTGTGMTPAVKERIFEPFFTTKQSGKGTGLGLSTVYGIVQQSAGSVSVESEPGRGTSFRLLFPAIDSPQTAPLVASPGRDALSGTETILVTDDEPGVLAYVRAVLEQNGYRVIAAASGREALDLSHRTDLAIDLLLTDVVMPEMSGVRLGSEFRKVRPGIPILFISGYNEGLRNDDGSEAYLRKPFSSMQLLAMVREALDAVKSGVA